MQFPSLSTSLSGSRVVSPNIAPGGNGRTGVAPWRVSEKARKTGDGSGGLLGPIVKVVAKQWRVRWLGLGSSEKATPSPCPRRVRQHLGRQLVGVVAELQVEMGP